MENYIRVELLLVQNHSSTFLQSQIGKKARMKQSTSFAQMNKFTALALLKPEFK